VIDPEPLIVSVLDRLVPLPSGARADWQDVLQRAGETRRRRLDIPRPGTWSRLQIAVVVIVVGLMLVAAATATYVAIYVAGAPPSKRLVAGQVVKLRELAVCPPKCTEVSTHLRRTKVAFEPFGYGWFGYQADETGFVIGDNPGGLQQRTRPDFAVGVNGIELPLKQAAKQLEKTPGVRVLSVDKGEIFDHPGVPYPRLNGHPAHLYRLLLSRPKLHEIFGIPAQSFSGRTQPSWPIHPQMGARERRVDIVLIGAGRKTFLVRFGDGAVPLDPAYYLLMSLRFHTDGS
jgi:hypothetical protein